LKGNELKVIYSAIYHDDCHPFNVLAESVDVVKHPDELEEGNSALVIWGGSDINPELYRHPIHRTTHPGGLRDRLEWSLLQRAIERGIPIWGVCRGAQMLCAAAGGWLIQDVRNHAGFHEVNTIDGKDFQVNSIHHQMMAGLETVDHELVAWRPGRMGAPYGYKDNQVYVPELDFKEPEFVYFPKINGYAVQWHPEAMATETKATQYILDYFTKKEQERGSYAEVTLESA
jgi:gamma-glutamyl-gamma-aminobutyrate hydrolase PuuD